MSTRFLALIVVYGTDPVDTTSLQTLLANEFDRGRRRILVWDNSPTPKADAKQLQRAGLLYRSTPENLGLSIIYNRVIAQELRPDEHLLLLDQDTVLPATYLANADAAIRQHPDIDLFLPMIRANGNWVSPLDYYLGWGRYWPAPREGRMKSGRICAINSGMVIAARYLQEDGRRQIYDELLRFYGTDTQFMLDYSDRRDELVVLDARLEHDLSFFSDSVQERARKFAEMRAAYRQIYVRRPLAQRLGVAAVMTAISLLYACRYRSLRFLRRQT